MTQKFNTTGYPEPASTWVGSDYLARVLDGLHSALSDYAGASDPSTSAPTPWGADEVGYRWLDTTDPSNPVLKRWELLTSPSTYGWRSLRLFKTKWLVTPKAVSLVGSPAGADYPGAGAWADYDFSTDLDDGGSGNVQDAGQTEHAVLGVFLRQRVKADAAETLGADDAKIEWRTKGSTNTQAVLANVAGRYTEATLFVPLDADEVAQYRATVGGGTPAFDYATCEILGLVEAA